MLVVLVENQGMAFLYTNLSVTQYPKISAKFWFYGDLLFERLGRSLVLINIITIWCYYDKGDIYLYLITVEKNYDCTKV